MDPKLLSLDFAALHTLREVHRTGSFTHAADALEQSQPNVSYTIARLRELFGDPLFVREGGQTRPTPRCDALVAASTTLLAGFESAVREEGFDPATAEGVVTIAGNHYERATILPDLIRQMRQTAPGLRLVALASRTIGGEQLKQGRCDLVIGPVDISGASIYRRHLRNDHYVALMDPSHPLASGTITPQALAQTPQVAVSFAGRWQPLYAPAFEAHGLELNTVVEVAEHGDIGAYVIGTDLVAIVPNRLADSLSPVLVRRPLPFEVPLQVNMFWTARTHDAPLFRWLRNQIANLEKTP